MAYESLEVVMSCRFSLSGYLKFIPYYRMTFNLMKLVKGQSFNDGTIESGVVITREERALCYNFDVKIWWHFDGFMFY